MHIGEPKHGVWRVHDNGFIREYRKTGRIGLHSGVDANSANLTTEQKDIIRKNYAAFIPGDANGYKHTAQPIKNDYQEYIDLTIYHEKYNGKYDDHVPIDLSHFYCTLSQPGFPHAESMWRYATAQPMANKIGPLGKRAGERILDKDVGATQGQ